MLTFVTSLARGYSTETEVVFLNINGYRSGVFRFIIFVVMAWRFFFVMHLSKEMKAVAAWYTYLDAVSTVIQSGNII